MSVVGGLEDSYAIPIILGIIICGCSFCIFSPWVTLGAIWGYWKDLSDDYQTTTDVAIRMSMKPKTRGLPLWLLVGITGLFEIMYWLLFYPENHQFGVRQNADLPLLFSSCNQDNVDDGICAPISRFFMYVPIYILVGWMISLFLKFNFRTSILYIIFWTAARSFLYLFSLYYEDGAKWTFYAISTAFGVGIVLIHIFSFLDSILHNETDVPNPEGWNASKPSSPLFERDEGQTEYKRGKWTNTINYNWATSEFWINLLFPFPAILGYWIISAIGTSGARVINLNTEGGVYFAFDIVVGLILIWALYSWIKKSDLEVKSVSSQFGSNNPIIPSHTNPINNQGVSLLQPPRQQVHPQQQHIQSDLTRFILPDKKKE